MSSTPESLNLDELLQHASWVRRLARGLVLDDAQGEDVVQETWLAALRRTDRAPRSLRQWLAAVTRLGARDLRRGEARRRLREARAALPEGLPSAQEIVAQEEERRQIVLAVAALPEIYRTVLLMRFFQERAPRVIARQLGVPLETVRTRLRRGMGLLREDLDARFGTRREVWSAALLPWCVGGTGIRFPWLELWMGRKAAGAIAAVLVLLCSWGVFRAVGPPPTPPVALPPPAADAGPIAGVEETPEEPADSRATRLVDESAPQGSAIPAGLTGVVLDPGGGRERDLGVAHGPGAARSGEAARKRARRGDRGADRRSAGALERVHRTSVRDPRGPLQRRGNVRSGRPSRA